MTAQRTLCKTPAPWPRRARYRRLCEVVPAVPAPKVTPAEYLAAEHAAEHKHILWDGEVFAMAGASKAHNRLVAALLRELGNLLLQGPCSPYASDQRIRLGNRARYVYPDASVICAPVETDPLDTETITNPTLIVEVLSDSTEAFDRGNKFVGYRELKSLKDYLLISQHHVRVEHYMRDGEGGWLLRTYEAGSQIPIVSLGITLHVDALYNGIELTATADDVATA